MLFTDDLDETSSQRDRNGAERVVTFLNDLNLAALSIAIVIFVCYVLARAQGLETQPTVPRTYLVKINEVKIDGKIVEGFSDIASERYQFDVFAVVDGKIITPKDTDGPVRFDRFGSSSQSPNGLPSSDTEWLIELNQSYSATDKLVFHLVNAPSSVDATKLQSVSYQICPGLDDRGNLVSASRDKYFFAAVSIQKLLSGNDQISEDQFSATNLVTSLSQGGLQATEEQSYRLAELGPDGELFSNSLPDVQDVLHRDVSILPDLKRNKTCTIVFNHLVDGAFPNTRNYWHARLILEGKSIDFGQGSNLDQLEQYLKPIHLQLGSLLASIYSPRDTDQTADQHRWHLHSMNNETANKDEFLLVQSLQKAPIIHSRAIWLDGKDARWIFLSPDLQARLTSDSAKDAEAVWNQVRERLSQVITGKSLTWLCVSAEQIAYAEYLQRPDEGNVKITLNGPGDESQKVTLSTQHFPKYLLGQGSKDYLESTWWSDSLPNSQSSLPPQLSIDDRFVATLAMLLQLNRDDPFIFKSLGTRQNPNLWGQHDQKYD